MNFEFEFNKLNLIYFKARQSFEIFKYLRNQSIENDQFWLQVNYLSFKDTILELDKLYSDRKNQKFRIRKFLEKLKANGEYKKFNFDETILLHWENEVLNFESTLEKIKNLRDEHFAHTDIKDSLGIESTSIDYRHVFEIAEIERLFSFVEKVLTKVYADCKKGYWESELFFTEQTIKIFEDLNELKSFKQKEILNQLRNNKPSV